MTEHRVLVILKLILDEKSDPRLLGKIVSLTGVFCYIRTKKKLCKSRYESLLSVDAFIKVFGLGARPTVWKTVGFSDMF